MNTRDVTWVIYKGEVEQPRLNCRLTFIASCIACRKHRRGESEEGSRDQECVQTANSRQCPCIYHGNLKRCCGSTRWQIDARRICRDNCCVSRPEKLRIEREREMKMQTRLLGHVKQVKQTNVQRQHITQLRGKLSETANKQSEQGRGLGLVTALDCKPGQGELKLIQVSS